MGVQNESGMADQSRAIERLSEYESSQSACAGPLGGLFDVERAKGRASIIPVG